MLGIAFDLGTTSLAAYLCDLNDKCVIKVASRLNPQIKIGADVITRITYMAQSPENRREVCELLGDAIIDMTGELMKDMEGASSEGGVSEVTASEDGNWFLDSIVLVGNPVIMGSVSEYYFGAPLKKYAASPSDDVYVIGVPMIGGYAGADALAGAFLVNERRKGKNALLIDIGTNGEIVLLTDDKKIATTAAAGPALEGGNVECGMRGEEGAVDSVKLSNGLNPTSDILIHVLGSEGGKPEGEKTKDFAKEKGVCGSGLLSMLECLLKARVINETGYIQNKGEAMLVGCPPRIASRITETEKGRAFKLSESLYIYQDDIRALQLAISALRTGIEMLIREAELTVSVIDEIYLAGAFGNKISIESALAVGLLPPVNKEKIIQAGNLAGEGACRILTDMDCISGVTALKNEIKTISLAEHPDFKDNFMKYMIFDTDSI